MSQHDQDLQQEQQLLEHFRRHSRGEPSAALDALILDAARQAVNPPAARPSRARRLHAWLFGAGSRTRWSVAVAGLAVFGIGLNLSLHTREQLPGTYDMPAPPAAPAVQEMAPVMEARKQSNEPEYKKAEQAEKAVAGSIEPHASFSVSPAATAQPRQMAPAKPQAAEPVQSLADSAAAPAEADAAPEVVRSEVVAKAKAYSEARAKTQAEAEAQAGAAPNEEQLAASLGHSSVDEAPPLEFRLRTVLQLRREGKQADADRLLAALRQDFPQRDLDAELKRLQAEMEKPDSSR